MASFISCKYHETQNMGNVPVNIDQVQYFDDVENTINFYFGDGGGVTWEFENEEAAQKEYQRLIDLLVKS